MSNFFNAAGAQCTSGCIDGQKTDRSMFVGFEFLDLVEMHKMIVLSSDKRFINCMCITRHAMPIGLL